MLKRDIEIRLARQNDCAGVSALLADLGYPASADQVMKRFLNAPELLGGGIFVAEVNGRLVGLASFHRIPLLHVDGFLGRITSFVVSSDCRREGVGHRLANAVEDFAWQKGCLRLEVTSGDQRRDAHSFYERQGFKLESRRFLKQRPDNLQSTDPKLASGTPPTGQESRPQ